MNSPLHTVELTDEQLFAVKQLFQNRGWELKLHSSSRYKEMKEAADEYVKLHTTMLKGRDSPTRNYVTLLIFK